MIPLPTITLTTIASSFCRSALPQSRLPSGRRMIASHRQDCLDDPLAGDRPIAEQSLHCSANLLPRLRRRRGPSLPPRCQRRHGRPSSLRLSHFCALPPPHSLSSPDRLPSRRMLPLLLRPATAFRAVVGAALHRSFGISSAAAAAASTSAAAPRRRVGPRRRWRRPIRVDNDAPRQHRLGLFFSLVRRFPRHIDDDERRGAPKSSGQTTFPGTAPPALSHAINGTNAISHANACNRMEQMR